jgi:hypothetical protein
MSLYGEDHRHQLRAALEEIYNVYPSLPSQFPLHYSHTALAEHYLQTVQKRRLMEPITGTSSPSKKPYTADALSTGKDNWQDSISQPSSIQVGTTQNSQSGPKTINVVGYE